MSSLQVIITNTHQSKEKDFDCVIIDESFLKTFCSLRGVADGTLQLTPEYECVAHWLATLPI